MIAARIQRIAILNFDRGPGVTLARDVLVDKFTAALVDSKFRIVDRTDTRKIMEEAKFQQAGGAMIDETTREKLRQLGADTILTGNLHAYQEERKGNFVLYSEVHLTSKLLKVETGQVLWSGEIMKRSKAKNRGRKDPERNRRESERIRQQALDAIISDMADSLQGKEAPYGKNQDLVRNPVPKILIVYASQTGNTERMARAWRGRRQIEGAPAV